MLVFVHSFGCRTSLCEGEYIASSLAALGAQVTDTLASGINAAVIITCSVTQEADRKSRQLIRRSRRLLGREGVLAVCGCWGQTLKADTAREMGIDILAGTKGKSIVPSELVNMLGAGRGFIDIRECDITEGWEELSINYPMLHSRAFMKIQDGCNHFCTFCVIPYLRGKPSSRPINNILSEIHRLLDRGIKEVIFTGIHLGLYGRDINTSLSELIKIVSGINGLERIRLGSLEPFCLDDELLGALSDCEAFCPHLHLPLQSGDDEILAMMRRGYTAGDYLRVCDRVRERLGDDVNISADVLVGFPGESEGAFMNTLRVMRSAGLGRVHVFPYSERQGTIAAGMSGKITNSVKTSRASIALASGHKLQRDYAGKFIGHEVSILVERDNKGHSRHYIECECDGSPGEIVRAEAIREVNGKLECMRRD